MLKVVQETEKPDPNANIVEEHISADQALTSKILRVVNSAYYGLSGQVTSVQQAIVILGLQQVRNLALSVGCLSNFEPRTVRQKETLRIFWLAAFGTAAATQILAQQKSIDPRSSQIMFVGGLLHDIGRLFLFCNFPDEYDEVLQTAMERKVRVEDVELEILGMTHAQVGYEVAKHWKLPVVLQDLIGKHEGPFDSATDEVLICVHVADALTKHLYYAPPVDFKDLAVPEAIEWLDSTGESFDLLVSSTEKKIEEASALYGLLAA